MNRGDRREPIFQDDEDHRRFLETLGEACGKTGWQVHAFCLMIETNHRLAIAARNDDDNGMDSEAIVHGHQAHLAHLFYCQQRHK